jgi:transposase
VYAFFARWRDSGLVSELHERLHQAVRRAEGRAPEPSAAVIDSQSVKADATVAYDSRGFDAGKKINGRKRHLLTDTLGFVLDVAVTPASTTDRDAARILLPAARVMSPCVVWRRAVVLCRGWSATCRGARRV